LGQQSATLASTASTTDLGIAAGALGDEPVERAFVAVWSWTKDSSRQSVSVFTTHAEFYL